MLFGLAVFALQKQRCSNRFTVFEAASDEDDIEAHAAPEEVVTTRSKKKSKREEHASESQSESESESEIPSEVRENFPQSESDEPDTVDQSL